MSILVLGGAGYIGSHTVKKLIEQGENVVIADNLQLADRPYIWMRSNPRKPNSIRGDIRDRAFLGNVYADERGRYRRRSFILRRILSSAKAWKNR